MKEHKTHIPPHPYPLPPGERVTVGKIHQTFSSSLKGKGNPYTLPSTLTGEGEGGGGKDGYLLKRLLGNSRGLSVLFLVIAMMLMVAIGYVFSYLIPTKQKSVSLTVSSTQAFFLAQSGVEFAVRYATEQNWATPVQLNGLDGMTRNLGRGNFILDYDESNNRLISRGQIPNSSERRIVVSNFTQFLPQPGLILWIEPPTYPAPCWAGGNTNIRFFIKNTGASPITLNRFSATWTIPPNNRNITAIIIGANTVFSGSYNYPNCDPCIRSFTPVGTTQIVNANQVLSVQVTWNQNISPQLPVTLSFYDTANVEYQFILQPTVNCP